MKSNIGTTDKIIRLIIAAVCAILFFTGTITGIWGYVMLAVGAILALTSVISFCPIWYALGINTMPKAKKS